MVALLTTSSGHVVGPGAKDFPRGIYLSHRFLVLVFTIFVVCFTNWASFGQSIPIDKADGYLSNFCFSCVDLVMSCIPLLAGNSRRLKIIELLVKRDGTLGATEQGHLSYTPKAALAPTT